MDWETQKQIVREQRAGYDWLARMNLEEARRATLEDRLGALDRILRIARELRMIPGPRDEAIVAERWRRIRERYDAGA